MKAALESLSHVYCDGNCSSLGCSVHVLSMFVLGLLTGCKSNQATT